MKRNAKIIATGLYAPDNIIDNEYFNKLLNEDVGTWLEENLTIRERRWCSENESTADLVEAVSNIVLTNAGLTASELDLIIVSTDTPEYISPSTASVLQNRIGAKNAGTFDINTACAGFVTALDMGAKYIQADERYINILVIGAYCMSKYLNMEDKKTVTLFADGAGAVILQATTDKIGWLGSQLHTEGQYADWMGIYAGGTKSPISNSVIANHDHQLKFVKKFPKEINPSTWTKMVTDTVNKAGFNVQDIDMIFLTQININSIRETMNNLGLPMERTHTIMERYGYTGSACIPMALAEANALGKLKPGDRIVFMGSGGGLAFATAVFKW
ncbi:3-oxoacyl-ACP synthase III family protein [Candidatus Neomarinimicrobiota bacterium]